MSSMNVILLLGSDLGDRENNLESARHYIESDLGEIIKVGEILETEPVGFTSCTKFLNQLVEISTELSPIQLLKSIKTIENRIGRVYKEPLPDEKYVSRIIDIDILQMNGIKFKSKELLIPHNQNITRIFVHKLLELF